MIQNWKKWQKAFCMDCCLKTYIIILNIFQTRLSCNTSLNFEFVFASYNLYMICEKHTIYTNYYTNCNNGLLSIVLKGNELCINHILQTFKFSSLRFGFYRLYLNNWKMFWHTFLIETVLWSVSLLNAW